MYGVAAAGEAARARARAPTETSDEGMKIVKSVQSASDLTERKTAEVNDLTVRGCFRKNESDRV